MGGDRAASSTWFLRVLYVASTAHLLIVPLPTCPPFRSRAVAVGYGSYSLFFVRPAVRKAQMEAAAAAAAVEVAPATAAAAGDAGAPAAAAAPLR
jgi:hypothetical protein